MVEWIHKANGIVDALKVWLGPIYCIGMLFGFYEGAIEAVLGAEDDG